MDPDLASSRHGNGHLVLDARANRRALVRHSIATVTSEDLASLWKNAHAPDDPEVVLSCPRTILEKEWEHHRYAVRDLDTLAHARLPRLRI